jgi:hypothetical protein
MTYDNMHVSMTVMQPPSAALSGKERPMEPTAEFVCMSQIGRAVNAGLRFVSEAWTSWSPGSGRMWALPRLSWTCRSTSCVKRTRHL